MKTHSRFVFGSLAGALVIHFAMVACSSGGEAPASDGGVLADVRRVVRLLRIAEYKRRQAPVGIRVTQRGFGKDWRYPITNRYQDEF